MCGVGVLSPVGDHILQVFNTLYLTRFRTYKIATPPQTKTDKHLPQSPLQINCFRWRHYALVSIKLISPWPRIKTYRMPRLLLPYDLIPLLSHPRKQIRRTRICFTERKMRKREGKGEPLSLRQDPHKTTAKKKGLLSLLNFLYASSPEHRSNAYEIKPLYMKRKFML